MPPKTSHPHRPRPLPTILPRHPLKSQRWSRPCLPQRLQRSPSKTPAGPHPRLLHLRSRTCPWRTSPHLRRPSSLWLALSQQALQASQSPSVPRLLRPSRLLSLPRASSLVPQSHHLQLRQRPPLLVLTQGLWPKSLGRNQRAAAKAVQLPGRMPVRPWSPPHSCRWCGCALWVLLWERQPRQPGLLPPRSRYEGPCRGGPARRLPPPQGSMLLSDSRPPVWQPAGTLGVPSRMDHLRRSHGLPSPLPQWPASSSPRVPRSCSWSGRCPPRPGLTSNGTWWLNFGTSQSSGHPKPQRSHLKLPHLWPASPLGGSHHPPPLPLLGLSLFLALPPMGSFMLRTGLRGSWRRMEVSCSWWGPRSRSWPRLAQTHRKSWSDHQAPRWHC